MPHPHFYSKKTTDIKWSLQIISSRSNRLYNIPQPIVLFQCVRTSLAAGSAILKSHEQTNSRGDIKIQRVHQQRQGAGKRTSVHIKHGHLVEEPWKRTHDIGGEDESQVSETPLAGHVCSTVAVTGRGTEVVVFVGAMDGLHSVV